MTGNTQTLVDTAWLADHLDDPNVRLIEIDWTGTGAYDEGHIPGALGWNWKETLWDPAVREFPTPEEFARRLGAAGIANDTTVVFYGGPVQFGTYGWWVFKFCGHADVRMLDGGRVRWVKEGRPLSREVPKFAPVEYIPAARNDSMRIGRDGVLDHIGREGTLILDHRSPEEYRGEMVGVPGMPDVGAERYGRIPGARHLPFTDFLGEDETFKDAGAIRSLLEECGAAEARDIISYCRLSHRATLAYFAMTEILDHGNLKVYDGSWTEWGSMVGMPIDP
ncbi:MAG: sulfurtransferase [Rhodospirillales bacterium]|nr:sulfurtransferase [Rhodospirillales bacterium]